MVLLTVGGIYRDGKVELTERSHHVDEAARWPKTSSTLGNEQRRIAPQLRIGLSINFDKNREGRLITSRRHTVRLFRRHT